MKLDQAWVNERIEKGHYSILRGWLMIHGGTPAQIVREELLQLVEEALRVIGSASPRVEQDTPCDHDWVVEAGYGPRGHGSSWCRHCDLPNPAVHGETGASRAEQETADDQVRHQREDRSRGVGEAAADAGTTDRPVLGNRASGGSTEIASPPRDGRAPLTEAERFYQQPVEDLVTHTVAAVNKITVRDVLAYLRRSADEHRHDASYSGGRAAFAEIAFDQLELALQNEAAAVDGFRQALESIANNSCCGPCLEASNVAKRALDLGRPAARETE